MPLFTRPLPSAAALAICAVGAAFAAAPAAHAAVVFSLASSGQQLIRFDSASPGVVTTVGAITGAGSLGLSGLDFRPADGQLYGYSHQTGSVYTVDRNTGVATLVTAISAPTNAAPLGIDFNPVPDRLRIVTASDQNLRVNVAGGATVVDGTLAYAAGDANVGVNPSVVDAAYTNSDTLPATGTQLYYIDHGTNSLVSTASPNAGVLNTVGALGVDTSDALGFDIFTDFGVNTGFATLNVGGVNGLYGINLASGAATLLGVVGNTTSLWGLAVVQGNTVPEPGSLALVGLAGAVAWAGRRRARPAA